MSKAAEGYDKLSEEDKITVNITTLSMLSPLLESQGHPQIAHQLEEISGRLDDYRRLIRRGYPSAD